MAKFSKQHYQAIAQILKDELPHGRLEDFQARKLFVDSVAHKMADLFEGDNERFDRQHFLAVVRGERPVNSRPR